MALFRRRKNNTDSEPEVASENLETDTPRVGPYDEADAPEDLDNIDAGSLRLPVVDGIKLQFSVDKARQTVLAALYQTEDSGVQIQAFAAPKSNGIWESVRADVAQSIVAQGGRCLLYTSDAADDIALV